MKLNRKWMLIVALVMSVAMATSGTLAYLTSEDADVNVMTLGNVKIEQHEYERAVDANDDYVTYTETKRNGNPTGYKLTDFAQVKPLYPAVGTADWDSTMVYFAQLPDDSTLGAQKVFSGLNNVQDKFVFVENTGKSDAYVRTIMAFEIGTAENAMAVPNNANDNLIMMNYNDMGWTRNFIGTTVIDNNNFYLVEFVYDGSNGNGKHPDGIVHPGEFTNCNLAQVYLTPKATNDDVEALDGNDNGTYDILVFSQAVQAASFDSAKAALDTAFGAISTTSHPWVGEVKIPEVSSWEGVTYVTGGEIAEVSSNGGNTVYRGLLSEGAANGSSVVKIGEGITRLNNRALCKDANLKEVHLPDSLTYIDEGVFQQSGFVEIEIPENVTYIGKQAFGACSDLEKIVIKAKDVTIGNYVVRACANLKEVYIYSDSVTFESGSMYFTNKENADASAITFYVKDQAMADNCYAAFSTSHSYGLLIKSLDGATTYYNTLK